jgi:carboxyl-terminal processing protease
MPRPNFLIILASALISLACYKTADRNPYGRYFAEVIDQIERRHVEPVDRQRLFVAAIEGMVGQLDEHSAFFAQERTPGFQEVLDQRYGGIGIEIRQDRQTQELVVVTPIVGTPAYRAGILAGDRIIEIDGQSTRGMALKDAVARMRGRPGEAVRLTIQRPGEPKPLKLPPIVRESIKIESVLGDRRRPDGTWDYTLQGHPEIGYLRITNFGESTAAELDQAIKQLQAQGMKGLILDLRFNPGGLLKSAVDACDRFVASGTIVTTRGRNQQIRDRHEATAANTYLDFPIVVLVNHLTASASEIVAACLQDHDRAVVVGQRTYGKGTVQDVIPIEGGRSLLKLTTANYWRPSGRNIHRRRTIEEQENGDWGVKPNAGFAVEMTDEQTNELFEWRRNRDVIRNGNGPEDPELLESIRKPPTEVDPQVRRAVEHLLDKLRAVPLPSAA